MRSICNKLARSIVNVCIKGSLALLTLTGGAHSARSQVLVDVPNSTGTGVAATTTSTTPTQYEIFGGTRSENGDNLFHRLSQFNLSAGQSAQFIAEPDIQNIFSHITGSYSVIDGTLTLSTGATANLFLINPAGVLFGPNAQLNLPANFTATTATGIGFENQILNLLETLVPTEDATYALLNGSPTAFEFETNSAIANLANLSVNKNSVLSLMGGTLINTGNLTAGDLNLSAIEPGRRIRINPSAQLLAIEVLATEQPTSTTLAAMLTGSGFNDAELELRVVDGQVQLAQTDITVPENQASIITQGTLNADSDTDKGGQIEIFGSQVGVVEGTITASGLAGGQVQIGRADLGSGNLTEQLYIGPNSSINADSADENNNGLSGQVAIWAKGDARIYGDISLQGNSGSIDITGNSVTYEGTTNLEGDQPGAISFNTNNVVVQSGAADAVNAEEITDLFSLSKSELSTLYEETLESLRNLSISAKHDIIIGSLEDGALTFQSGDRVSFFADSNERFGGQFSMRSQDSIEVFGGNLSIRNGSSEENLFQVDQSDGVTISVGRLTTTSSNDTDSNDTVGSIELIGDSISLTGGQSGIKTRTLTLDAYNSSTNIQLGDGENRRSQLDLSEAELTTALDDRIEELYIGRDTGANAEESETGGAITMVSDITFSPSVTLRSPTTINTNGYALATTGSADLTLQANGDITTGTLTTENGDITVNTPGYFRAVESKLENGDRTSIETGGNNKISIRHGGNGTLPFTVGDAGTNGTAGRIVTQTTELVDTLAVLASETFNTISILTEALDIPEAESPDKPSLVTPTERVPERAPERVSESILPEPPIQRVAQQPPAQLEVEAPLSPQLNPPTIRTSNLPASIAPILEDSQANESLSVVLNSSESDNAAELFSQLESSMGAKFEAYLSPSNSRKPSQTLTLFQVQDTLQQVQTQRNARSSLVYVYFVPNAASSDSVYPNADRAPQPDDQLEIMLVNAEGDPIRKRHWGVTRKQVETVAADFRYQTTHQFSRPADYLEPAQQLYSWLIAPMEKYLTQAGTNNLAMIMDDGLRTLPLAALHDGEQFLIEKYSLGLMPTVSLTDFGLNETPSHSQQVLAMGASQFDNQPPLPAVKAELAFISEDLWLGSTFLNEHFTLQNLKSQIASQEYGIVHLATHAAFEPGNIDNSYIQLWNDRLRLSQLQDLNLEQNNIDLIILSACSTATGDQQAEYGFAGFAVSAGSRSALASLWPVSDEGTLGFMTQFYRQLTTAHTRSEALRAAQIAMLKGEVGIHNGQVYGPQNDALSTIPELEASGSWDFSHPFYWSAFTMIGSPW
ncbi:MAG: CHAT domain-containing protein [Cyanobacteria bacterium P01_A01_bin.116]